MNRKLALEVIRIDFATNGKDSGKSSRAYIESGVSFAAFQDAAQKGLKQYEQKSG